MKFFFFTLPILLLFSACQGEQQKTTEKKTLPNSPGEVAQQWVEAFYNDDYTKAIELGTNYTRMMIDSARKEMVPDVQPIAFKIYNMSCEAIGDSALCTYIYQEEGYNDQESISLVKEKGQWLVDVTWDNATDGEMEVEEILEELEKIIEEDNKF